MTLEIGNFRWTCHWRCAIITGTMVWAKGGREMRLQFILRPLLLLAAVTLAGCYTQLGYYESSYFQRKTYQPVARTSEDAEESEHAANGDVEELERQDRGFQSRRHEEAEEESEGYYGRRQPRRYEEVVDDVYWGVPYAPYPYLYYPSMFYYPSPWFYGYRYYGYHAPYYRYYGGYYPYTGYHYGRYRGGTYPPLARRTYKSGNLRLENRRSRSSRSVTSPRSKSERPQRRARNRN